MRCVVLLAMTVSLLLTPAKVLAGKIVLNNDEWTTSDAGFLAAGASAETFVDNLASFFLGGGGGGNFLAYSNDFSLNEPVFANTLTSAGHSLTVSTAITFDLPTLLGYDAVFLAGAPGADTGVLSDYVNAGGGVYLAGGTFFGGGATGEANAWNPFLNDFGLGLAGGAYNGVTGLTPVTGVHPILSGVTNLYYNNGNSVVLFGANPNAQIIESAGQNGLLGVYDDTNTVSQVPEPGTSILLAIGLLATGLMVRRRCEQPTSDAS